MSGSSMFLDACKTILSLVKTIHLYSVVPYGLMLMIVPVKVKFEELITSCKIDRFGTPSHHAGEI